MELIEAIVRFLFGSIAIYFVYIGIKLAADKSPVINGQMDINTVIAIMINKLLGAIYISGCLIAFAILNMR